MIKKTYTCSCSHGKNSSIRAEVCSTSSLVFFFFLSLSLLKGCLGLLVAKDQNYNKIFLNDRNLHYCSKLFVLSENLQSLTCSSCLQFSGWCENASSCSRPRNRQSTCLTRYCQQWKSDKVNLGKSSPLFGPLLLPQSGKYLIT